MADCPSTPTLPMTMPKQPSPPPRPSDRDTTVRTAALHALLPAVLQWLGPDVPQEPDALAKYKLDVLQDLEKAWDDNGYKMAKNLEHAGWYPDAELVEELDAASNHLFCAHNAAVKHWVEANGIQPKCHVDDRVTHARYGTGRIVAIQPETAVYVVLLDTDAAKFTKVLLPFEECSLEQATEGSEA